MCACTRARGSAHAKERVWQPEDNLVGMVLPTFTWVSGIKLRLPGLHGQHLYPLSYLIVAPPPFFLTLKCFWRFTLFIYRWLCETVSE